MEQLSRFFGEQPSLPFSSSPARCLERSGLPSSEQLELVVEDIVEGGTPASCARRSSGSKRSRAAEVHNLSEKRRRSKINEKMRALQNLIPNSNKTDKASMLDEAIEYLKQLQLQVQMLSMRNGLNLHDVYLSSHQIHQIQNIGTSLPASQEPFQLPITAELLADGIALQHQLEARPAARDTTDGMKASRLQFGGESSSLQCHGHLQEDILDRVGAQSILPRHLELQFNIQHFDGLQSGRSLIGNDVKAESVKF